MWIISVTLQRCVELEIVVAITGIHKRLLGPFLKAN